MSTVPPFPMSEATAQRLFDIFTNAELAYQIEGTPHEEFLRREANKTLGQTRKYLLRVAALGPDIPKFMDYFLEDWA